MNASLLKLTASRLARQSTVPLSPGRSDDNGEPLLCLGAALVAAHLQLTRGTRSAQAFARHVVRHSSSEAILDEARASGFPVSSCQQAIAYNDGHENAVRKHAVLDYLAQIPA